MSMQAVHIVAAVISFGFTVIGLTLVTRTIMSMVKTFRSGRPDGARNDNPLQRGLVMTKETLGHTRMLKIGIVGTAHWFVMVAFGALFFTLVEAYGETIDKSFHFPLIGRFNAYGIAMELIALMCGLGILTLIAYRQLNKPSRTGRASRFTGSNTWMAYYVEATIVGIIACVFTIRALEWNILEAHTHANAQLVGTGSGALERDLPFKTWAAPLSVAYGHLFAGMSQTSLEAALAVVATIKIVVSIAWFCVIAANANMGIAWHRFLGFFNIYWKRNSDGSTALGPLKPIMVKGEPLNWEDPDEDAAFGVSAIEEFSWKDLIDVSTCTECGRCQSQCPAWNTGKPLSPKLLIMSLRDHLHAKAPYLKAGGGLVEGEEKLSEEELAALPEAVRLEAGRPLVAPASEGGIIDPDVLWSCTMCGACVEQCPVDIEHVDHIIDMRRYQVLIESSFPSEAGTMLRNIEKNGNPWGANPATRLSWADDLDFEVVVADPEEGLPEGTEWLFWVGCAGAFEDRAKKTTRAFAELLHMAGVQFAVLGPGESCTGDPARRLGAEDKFAMQAMQNVEVLNGVRAGRIVTTCAHCFNSLANEYPQFGGNWEVVHHTQLLDTLVAEGRLTPINSIEQTVTYHDPCFIGRHNGIYQPPREVLGQLPGADVQEMFRSQDRSFCCGAGGARMWMEEKIGKRINIERVEEALSLDPDAIAVSCPFCMTMLSDGLTAKKESGEARREVEVIDVASLWLRAVKPSAPPEVVGQSPADTNPETSPTTGVPVG